MVDSLPHDVVEHILERVPVNSLLRFKTVSKQWKLTIESPFFQERQLTQRQQSGDPDVLMWSVYDKELRSHHNQILLGSSSLVKIPTPLVTCPSYVPHGSCDGLVFLKKDFNYDDSFFVVNPTTGWYRRLPLSELHQFLSKVRCLYYRRRDFHIGFGKDNLTGTYKTVWLYNSTEVNLENATTCEVFDFSTNAWRYVTPASPYRILDTHDPVLVDGSLHWLTDCQETKVVSFDLHTEAFQVLCTAPFDHPSKLLLYNLDNRLCVSQMKWSKQNIWSFNPGKRTWDKMLSVDLKVTSSLFSQYARSPLALLDGGKKKKKNKLLLYSRQVNLTLVTLDLETKSCYFVFSAQSIEHNPVCYFQSLISIL